MKRWKKKARRWWLRLFAGRERKRPCAYCRENDRRSIICRDGSVVRVVPEYQILVVMHRRWSDQCDISWCPKCGRLL